MSLAIEWTNWPLLLVGAFAVFGGSALQASTGLGLGMVAAPALLLIDPRLVPGPLLRWHCWYRCSSQSEIATRSIDEAYRSRSLGAFLELCLPGLRFRCCP